MKYQVVEIWSEKLIFLLFSVCIFFSFFNSCFFCFFFNSYRKDNYLLSRNASSNVNTFGENFHIYLFLQCVSSSLRPLSSLSYIFYRYTFSYFTIDMTKYEFRSFRTQFFVLIWCVPQKSVSVSLLIFTYPFWVPSYLSMCEYSSETVP